MNFLWFRCKQKKVETEQFERQVTIEVEHNKNASAKTVAENKKITDNFNKLIRHNNFTIRIHGAAGGKH